MLDNKIKSHKDLIVWQKSIKLVIEIYRLLENFPKEEVFGLVSQIKRSAVSIPSNIAEGSGRGTRKDYRQFVRIALGSTNELETQLIIAKNLPSIKNLNYKKVDELLIEVLKMLIVLSKKLEPCD